MSLHWRHERSIAQYQLPSTVATVNVSKGNDLNNLPPFVTQSHLLFFWVVHSWFQLANPQENATEFEMHKKRKREKYVCWVENIWKKKRWRMCIVCRIQFNLWLKGIFLLCFTEFFIHIFFALFLFLMHFIKSLNALSSSFCRLSVRRSSHF